MNFIQFGQVSLPLSQIFILKPLVFASVNLKPVFPGHVLVAPRRVEQKLYNLTELETKELWETAQQVANVLEQIYQTKCSIGIQDGINAGQSIKHVHVHIIPSPFEQKEKVVIEDEFRQKRGEKEMMEEANLYKKYFEK